MMEAVRTSENSIYYETTRRRIPEGCLLQSLFYLLFLFWHLHLGVARFIDICEWMIVDGVSSL
jgi:hypothetical protein